MRVHKYGLLRPTTNSDLVRDQIKLAHHYRNKLVELERVRRTEIRKIIDVDPDVVEAVEPAREAAILYHKLRDSVARTNAKNRSRSKTDQDLNKKVVQVKKDMKKAFATLRKARRAVFKKQKEAITSIQDAYNVAQKGARAVCGVYWGTYLVVVEAAMKQSAKAPFYDGLEPNDPDFVRFRGEGRVGIQIQGGMDSTAVFGADTRLQVDRVEEDAWYHPTRGVRRKKSRTSLRIRVGSEGRNPIWAEWPMIMHRPLPEKSRVKQVVVNLRKIGPREEWSVDFFVDDKETPHTQYGATGVVGMDVGWRLFDDGSLRVACWYSEKGEKGEYRLSKELIESMRKADDLRSIRDLNFNEARGKLVRELKKTGVPLWMRRFIGKKQEKTPSAAQACAYLSQWKASARLAALTKKWCSEGVKDEQRYIYEELEKWRYHDFHLWGWETSQRVKSDRRRKNEYRNLACRLARKYKVLVLEKFPLTKVVKRTSVEEKSDNPHARSNRRLASIHELRGALGNAFEKCGEVRVVPAENTTKICAECGVVNHFDQAAELEHTCVGCGSLWDQDENASKVIYRRGERSNGEENPGGAR